MFLGRWEFLCNSMYLQLLLLHNRKGGSLLATWNWRLLPTFPIKMLLGKILSNFKLLHNIFVPHCMFITVILFFLLDWHKIVISWSFTKPMWSTAYLYMNGRKYFCRPRYALFHSKLIFGSWSRLVFTVEFTRTHLYHQSGCKCTLRNWVLYSFVKNGAEFCVSEDLLDTFHHPPQWTSLMGYERTLLHGYLILSTVPQRA